MEIISPIVFLYGLFTAPLTQYDYGLRNLNFPQKLLALLFLVHYANRAIISPLRTPSRSKHHLIVTLSGIFFNIQNGYTMGSYLSSPFASLWFRDPRTTGLQYKLGLTLWTFGFIGNIVHDEILLNIRRKGNALGKSRPDSNGGEHYGIPHGFLYQYISYPNYFCEWIEWLGFALASGPLPLEPSLSDFISFLSPVRLFQAVQGLIMVPASSFAPYLSPPWIFVFAEIISMFPRAYRGHKWYKQRFGDRYPKDRKIVIPFIL